MLWRDKRYNSINYHLKQIFNERVYKISLDGGMTCPNRDGTLDTRGCIFCSRGGSGDFAVSRTETVTKQLNEAIDRLHLTKPGIRKYIAYFQSFTNTYAPIDYLEAIFTEAISHPDVVCLSIATRPDCLPDEVIDLLRRLNTIKPVWVELGLQTIHPTTANYIRRGYELPVYDDAVNRLHSAGIEIITHVILGLPKETLEDMLATVRHICNLPVNGIKLQLLHVLKDTDLALDIDNFHILTQEEYTNILIRCLEIIPDNIVIHRVTGDAPKNLLIQPLWSRNKNNVLNNLNHQMKKLDTWQGRLVK